MFCHVRLLPIEAFGSLLSAGSDSPDCYFAGYNAPNFGFTWCRFRLGVPPKYLQVGDRSFAYAKATTEVRSWCSLALVFGATSSIVVLFRADPFLFVGRVV